MKTENIKKGMVFKNYKELCKFVEIEPTTGTAKKSQLKELKRFCEYHKEGQKIIIDKKYKIPKDKEDGRMDRLTQNVMGNMLVEQICIFGKKGDLSIFFSKNFLYRICEMHNDNYEFYRFKQEELSRKENIDIDIIRDFYNITNNIFVSNIDKGAKWLKSKKLATMYDTYAIKTSSGHRAVTKEEHAIIQSYEAKVIEENMNTNRVELFLYSSDEKNYKKLRERVCKKIKNDAVKILNYKDCERKKVLHWEIIVGLMDMSYYYPCYEFIGDINRIKKYYDKQFNKKEKEKANTQTINKINQSVDMKIKNAKEGKSNKSFRTKDEYKKNINDLTDKNIKR